MTRWLASISLALMLTASAGYAVPSAPVVARNGVISVRWAPEAAAARGEQHLRQAQLEPMATPPVLPVAEGCAVAIAEPDALDSHHFHPLFQRPPPLSRTSL